MNEQEPQQPEIPDTGAGDPSTRMALVFDPRLSDVWAAIFSLGLEEEGELVRALPTLLRMAYLRGYEDASHEEQPGELYDQLGVSRPPPSPSRPKRTNSRARTQSSRPRRRGGLR